jgi:hypothetical protein
MDTFTQANVSPEMGTEIANALGLSAFDLQIPDVYQKYSEITGYFGKFQDAPAVARMVARNAPLKEKLAKVHEYVGLRKSLDVLRESLKNIPSSDTITGDTEENRALRAELQSKESSLLSELQRYE